MRALVRMVITVGLLLYLMGNAQKVDAEGDHDVIEFRSGDRLTGVVEGIDGKGNVSFRPELAAGGVLVRYEGIEGIRFGARIPRPQAPGKAARKLEVTPNTVVLWHMDEGEGVLIHDASGNGHDGAISGARWVKGRIGKALAFDGLDDYVELDQHAGKLDFDTPATVTLWFKSDEDAIQGSGGILWSLGERVEGGSDKHFLIILGNTTPAFENEQVSIATLAPGHQHVYYASPSKLWIAGGPTWHQLTAVLDGSRTRAYFDGEELALTDRYLGRAASDTGEYGEDLTAGQVRMGMLHDDHGERNFFKGLIDEVAIYNRALSGEEILAQYSGRMAEKVLLADGSQVRGKVESLEGGELRFNSEYAGAVVLKKEWIGRVIFFLGGAVTGDRISPKDGVDNIYFRNGDKVSGTVKGITEQTMILQTDFGNLEISRDKVAEISFAKVDRVKQRTQGISLEAGFANGDKILGTLLELNGEHLRLDVPFCEKLTVDRWALRRLEFNKSAVPSKRQDVLDERLERALANFGNLASDRTVLGARNRDEVR